MRAIGLVIAIAVGAMACRAPPDPDQIRRRAELALAHGQLPLARALTGQAIALVVSMPQSQLAWRLRLLDAEIDLEGDDPAALAALPQRLAGALPLALAAGVIDARRSKILGQVAHKAGDGAAAQAHLDRARAIAVAAGDADDNVLLAEIDLALGPVLAARGGDSAKLAHTTIRRGIDRATTIHNGRLRAIGLNQLGHAALLRGRYGEALSFLDEALIEAQRAAAEPVIARIQLNRGICKNWLGDFDRGRALLQESAATRERLGLWLSLRNVLGSLGDSYWLSLEPDKAVPYYLRALELSRKQGPAPVRLWASNLASTYIKMKDWNAAARANDEAQKQPGATPQDEAAFALNAASIARGRGNTVAAEVILRHLLEAPSIDDADRWAAEAQLAPLLVVQGRAAEADEWFLRAFAHEEQARNEIGPDDQITFLARQLYLRVEYIDWLVSQGKTTAALMVSEASKARVLSHLLGSKLPAHDRDARDLMRLARARGETLVSYWVAPARSFAWVIGPGGVEMVVLPGQATIAAAVQAYREAIESGTRDPRTVRSPARSPAQELFDLVVAPLLPGLGPKAGKIVIAPDGPLFGAPFAALVVPGAHPHYWIEDVHLSLIPSLDLLPAAARRSRAGSAPRVFALGSPSNQDPDYPPLAHAGAELSSIQRHFADEGAVVVSGPAARPEAYLRGNLAGVSIVHFAAHANANPSSPLDASIVLSPGAHGGRLSVRDILTVPLSVDLVTISACRSAGARIYSGEGLLGLAWGFLSAGARSVVAGLWDVADGSTSALMDGFYAELSLGTPPAEALRAAQLRLLRSTGPWRLPFYWAAFSTYLGAGPAS